MEGPLFRKDKPDAWNSGPLLIPRKSFWEKKMQRDSAIHIHVSILPQTPLPSRLPHNIEQNSLGSIVGPCWLSI